MNKISFKEAQKKTADGNRTLARSEPGNARKENSFYPRGCNVFTVSMETPCENYLILCFDQHSIFELVDDVLTHFILFRMMAGYCSAAQPPPVANVVPAVNFPAAKASRPSTLEMAGTCVL